MEIKETYNYCYSDKFDIEEIEGRRLYINSDIDCGIIDTIVYHILRYNRLDKGIPVEERQPIILYVTSNGGSVVDGYALIDIISESVTPVYTVNLAYNYSMGLLIYLAGHKRYATKNATFLLHDGSGFCIDSSAKLRDRMNFETNQVETRTKEYIISRSNLTSKVYDEKYRIEWYMYAEEAKQNGFVDFIIGEDCTIDEII